MDDVVVDRRLLVPVSHEIIPIGPNNAASFFFFLSLSLSLKSSPFFFFFPLLSLSKKKKTPPLASQPSIVLIFCCRLSLPLTRSLQGWSSIFGFPFRMGQIQTLEFRPSRNTLCKKAKRPFAGRKEKKKKNVFKKKNPNVSITKRRGCVSRAGHIKKIRININKKQKK